jgi:hypothetical protein
MFHNNGEEFTLIGRRSFWKPYNEIVLNGQRPSY